MKRKKRVIINYSFILLMSFHYKVFSQTFAIENVQKINFKYNDLKNLEYPKWSMDGTYFSFEVRESNASEIYIYSIQKKEAQLVTSIVKRPGSRRRISASDNQLNWSPHDPEQYLFIGTGNKKETDIYYGYISSGTPKNITQGIKSIEQGTVLRYPVLSPIQKIFLFSQGGEKKSELYYFDMSINVERKNAKPIKQITSIPGMLKIQPQFSPDGKNVVFTGEIDGNADLYIIEKFKKSAGKPSVYEPKKLIDWPGSEEIMPSYSPYGEFIAFISTLDSTKQNKLFVMDKNGGNIKELCDNIVYEHYFGYEWHPKKDYLFFIKNSSMEKYPLCYVNIKTGDMNIVDCDIVNIHSISISSDSKKIAISSRGEKSDKNLTWNSIYIGSLKSR